MIEYTQGNLLEADVEAVVNTVNTVGVMGKGIALMFKERHPANFKAYKAACKAREVEVGKLFVTASDELGGPRWIINFPTKQHWRNPTKPEWVQEGLKALREFITENQIRSIAVPPLGCGNGGLDWPVVREWIDASLRDLPDTQVIVYEPTAKYQNVAKKQGVMKLTPARAMISELVRRYAVLGIECTILEIQKMAWFLERFVEHYQLPNELDFKFQANRYGPYADRLTHLLDSLDGSYLACDKRLSDASPFDSIRFKESEGRKVELFLKTEAKEYQAAFDELLVFIDGFQSPLGMEALATVDWLITREGCEANLASIKQGITHWPVDKKAAERKSRIFSDRVLQSAIERLKESALGRAGSLLTD
jgi:O-acetyl-ADP-ribose deacetylase (regulator of RNase III)